MTVSVGDTFEKVREFLRDQDSAAYRWSDAVLVAFLADAALELVRLRPDANAIRDALQLTAGEVIHDLLPADAIALMDVVRNMGADGTTPGNVILPATLDEMNRADRGWMAATADTTILNWLRHPTEPTKFYTSPPAHAVTQVWVELIYSRVPKPMTYRSFAEADVDIANDKIQVVGHGLEAGLKVVLPAPASGGALPTPLAARTEYFTLVPDGDHLQLEAALGGGAINLTDTGTGTNYIDSVLTVLPKYKYPLQLHVAGSALLEDRPEADPPTGERFLNLFYTSLGAKRAA